jgi:hypothetical protein
MRCRWYDKGGYWTYNVLVTREGASLDHGCREGGGGRCAYSSEIVLLPDAELFDSGFRIVKHYSDACALSTVIYSCLYSILIISSRHLLYFIFSTGNELSD